MDQTLNSVPSPVNERRSYLNKSIRVDLNGGNPKQITIALFACVVRTSDGWTKTQVDH